MRKDQRRVLQCRFGKLQSDQPVSPKCEEEREQTAEGPEKDEVFQEDRPEPAGLPGEKIKKCRRQAQSQKRTYKLIDEKRLPISRIVDLVRSPCHIRRNCQHSHGRSSFAPRKREGLQCARLTQLM